RRRPPRLSCWSVASSVLDFDWKSCRPPHHFCLKQMSVLMLCDDFQTCANGETQQWDERILEPDAVHIVAARSLDQLPGSLVTAEKRFQNEGINLAGRCYLPGR